MAIQDHNEVSRYNGLPLENRGTFSSGLVSASRVEQKDQISSEKEHPPKARKPYTITKQRERWTDEEHDKFIEALKLYGRAWRKIEEYIGTKTAVQIRSHAQKYFTKLVRESGTGTNIMNTVESLDIPPPRPKKRPSRPYPRKRAIFPDATIFNEGKALRSNSLKSLESDLEDQSPKSVFSALGLDTPVSSEPNGTPSEEDGSPLNVDSSPDPQIAQKFELFPKEIISAKEVTAEEPSGRIVKLFGANLLSTYGCSVKNNCDVREDPSGFVPRRALAEVEKELSSGCSVKKNCDVREAPSGFVPRRALGEVEKELSWVGSKMTSFINDVDINNDENPHDVKARNHMHCYGKREKSSLFSYLTSPREPSIISELLERSEGFLPYKKFISERENQPFPLKAADETNGQISIRLSL